MILKETVDNSDMARIKIESLSSSNSKFIQSRSDGPYLYMFIGKSGGMGCILFRIDVLAHLHNNNKPMSDAAPQLYDLQPLLVFPKPVLPTHYRCAILDSKIYIIPIAGRSHPCKFGFKDSKPTDVYMIRESDIMDIQPSEHNSNGQEYLVKIASLNGEKLSPTIFVAENKLYVLSNSTSSANQFEVYSPDSNTWRVLPSIPDKSYRRLVTCCVVLGKTVYFSTSPYSLQSFHLEEEKWCLFKPTTSPVFDRDISFEASAFLIPPVIIQGMAFGVLESDTDDSLTICASHLPDGSGDFKSSEYLRPSIAPDDEFLKALKSSRCPHVFDRDYECFSGYVVALDGEQVLCDISYGNGPPENDDDHCSIDHYTSYATVTFFKVAPGVYYQECRNGACDLDYASEKVNGEYVATRFFKAKLLHSAQFITKTNSLSTNGRIRSCLL